MSDPDSRRHRESHTQVRMSNVFLPTSIDLISTTQTVERGVPVGVEVASHGELQNVWDDVVGNYKFSTYV